MKKRDEEEFVGGRATGIEVKRRKRGEPELR